MSAGVHPSKYLATSLSQWFCLNTPVSFLIEQICLRSRPVKQAQGGQDRSLPCWLAYYTVSFLNHITPSDPWTWHMCNCTAFNLQCMSYNCLLALVADIAWFLQASHLTRLLSDNVSVISKGVVRISVFLCYIHGIHFKTTSSAVPFQKTNPLRLNTRNVQIAPRNLGTFVVKHRFRARLETLPVALLKEKQLALEEQKHRSEGGETIVKIVRGQAWILVHRG